MKSSGPDFPVTDPIKARWQHRAFFVCSRIQRCRRNHYRSEERDMRLLNYLLMAPALMVATSTLAAQPAYVDDRSTAASLVRSYYNAINRQEYARAYTYFGDNNAPQSYSSFAAGYADTVSVTVATGSAM